MDNVKTELTTAQSLEQWSFKVTGGGAEPFVIENFDKMLEAFNEYSEQFETMAITPSNVKEAKKAKAALNKIKKEFNDRRIEIARPYNDNLKQFKAQVDELAGKDGVFAEAIDHINFNVRMYDAQEKSERNKRLNELVEEMLPNYDFYPSNWQTDPSWLNKDMYTSVGAPSKKLHEAVSDAMKLLQNQKQEHDRSIHLVESMARMNNMDPSGWVAMVDQGATQQDIADRMSKAVNQREIKRDEPVAEKKVVDMETGEIKSDPVRRFTYTVDVTETQRQQLLNFMRQNDINYNVREG